MHTCAGVAVLIGEHIDSHLERECREQYERECFCRPQPTERYLPIVAVSRLVAGAGVRLKNGGRVYWFRCQFQPKPECRTVGCAVADNASPYQPMTIN
jgi:hypothetical protein